MPSNDSPAGLADLAAAAPAVLHSWQATQVVVIDLATAACLHFNLGAPARTAVRAWRHGSHPPS